MPTALAPRPQKSGRQGAGQSLSYIVRYLRSVFRSRYPRIRTTMVETITSFVVPVVMISANGLLALAFYNRLAALIGRLRAINKERFDLFTRLSAMAGAPQEAPGVVHIQRRLEILDELGHMIFARARLIRDALICLLVTVLLMLGCSLNLGIAKRWPAVEWLAPILFVAGVAVMALGIVRAIQELCAALATLSFEHDMLEQAQEENGNGSSTNAV